MFLLDILVIFYSISYNALDSMSYSISQGPALSLLGLVETSSGIDNDKETVLETGIRKVERSILFQLWDGVRVKYIHSSGQTDAIQVTCNLQMSKISVDA